MLWKILGNHLNRVHRRINWGKNHRAWMEGTPNILPWFSYTRVSTISQNDILSLSKFYSEAYHKFFVSTVISSHIMTVLVYSLKSCSHILTVFPKKTENSRFWWVHFQVILIIWPNLSCRNSSVGRALDWRSKGPWFNPGFRHYDRSLAISWSCIKICKFSEILSCYILTPVNICIFTNSNRFHTELQFKDAICNFGEDIPFGK